MSRIQTLLQLRQTKLLVFLLYFEYYEIRLSTGFKHVSLDLKPGKIISPLQGVWLKRQALNFQQLDPIV
ncbi:hypothetical protein [Anoxynatronum sibiricum]|uniref:hypothetical protein n=1 Tax=Anoxynatronum sibiricum TaxID=210623 RepID=UPI0031B85630